MKCYAAILAAGGGTRFGADKTQALLGDKPVWRWSFDAYAGHPDIDGVVLVGSASNIDALRAAHPAAVLGGHTRQQSSRIALESIPSDAEVLLIHDAARPFVSAKLISDVVQGVLRAGAAAAAMPVTDTIKQIGDGVHDLARSNLIAMQTPQGARVELLRRAHALARDFETTDELGLIERLGIQPEIVAGDAKNFKITLPDDLLRAEALLGPREVRTGLGYDVHRFSADSNVPLYLGGLRFDGEPGLEGHSDADALLHAATDALLGAAALGDIGVHFPNTDPRWRGERSSVFLHHAASLVAAEGWTVENLDVSVIAERPKIMPRAHEMREEIAQALGIDSKRVSVKATTNEGLGSIGRGEGIAAFAIATLARRTRRA